MSSFGAHWYWTCSSTVSCVVISRELWNHGLWNHKLWNSCAAFEDAHYYHKVATLGDAGEHEKGGIQDAICLHRFRGMVVSATSICGVGQGVIGVLQHVSTHGNFVLGPWWWTLENRIQEAMVCSWRFLGGNIKRWWCCWNSRVVGNNFITQSK
jgi:hypothetical protein